MSANDDFVYEIKTLVDLSSKRAAKSLLAKMKANIKNKRPYAPGPFKRATGESTADTLDIVENADGGFSIIADAPHIDALLEGAEQHYIVANTDKPLRFPVGQNKFRTAWVVDHPGMLPIGFFEDAVEEFLEEFGRDFELE